MRHSQVDKRATRTVPRQCVSDYGHNVHKDAPCYKNNPVEFLKDFGSEILSVEPMKQALEKLARIKQTKLTPEY